jgi:hypothetical protein
MYKVKGKEILHEGLCSLDEAMKYAKAMNEFVTITGQDLEIVGVFGADSIVDGKCPDGVDYTWMKRRTQ